jgi:hypothetical protein
VLKAYDWEESVQWLRVLWLRVLWLRLTVAVAHHPDLGEYLILA